MSRKQEKIAVKDCSLTLVVTVRGAASARQGAWSSEKQLYIHVGQ